MFHGFLTAAVTAAVLVMSPAFADDSWSGGPGRFVLLPYLQNLGVLDRETGLVWEKAPNAGAFTWNQAHARCNTLMIGGRMGWRLPTLQELTSLPEGAQLPANHPFTVLPPWNVGEHIWSATTSASNASNAWTMSFPASVSSGDPKGSLSHAWCVRFRQGVDPQ